MGSNECWVGAKTKVGAPIAGVEAIDFLFVEGVVDGMTADGVGVEAEAGGGGGGGEESKGSGWTELVPNAANVPAGSEKEPLGDAMGVFDDDLLNDGLDVLVAAGANMDEFVVCILNIGALTSVFDSTFTSVLLSILLSIIATALATTFG